MSTIDLVLSRLHPNQQRIVDSAARFNVVVCGRRFGKSELAIDLLANGALDNYPVAYFAPTYKMLSEVWRRFKSVLQPVIKAKNETDKRLELLTGGIIDFWSLDSPDGPRGRKYRRIVVDEAAMIPDPEIWPAVLRPLLTDYKGDAFFLSTPRGYNWFWQLYNLGNDTLQSEWASFQYPTVGNPHIDPDEVESARALLPDRLFRQEYLAEFIDDGGGVFRGVVDVSTGTQLDAPEPGHRYVAGLDWAKSNDFTVLSIWDSRERREVYIDRFNQVNWSLQRTRVRRLYDLFKIANILAESNSIGEPNIEALQSEGLPVYPFETTAVSKGPLIEGLALAIEKKECTLLKDPVATAEAQSYELERLPSGRFRYGAPAGMHDDTVIARALAWELILNPRQIQFAPNPFYKG